MYVIKPYLLHTFDNGELILQNKMGIFRISNMEMIKFLKKMDMYSEQKIKKEDIIANFSKGYDEAISFLESKGILVEVKNYTTNIENIHFFTNDKKFIKEVSIPLKECYENVVNIECFEQKIDFETVTTITTHKNSIILLFLNPLDKALLKKFIQYCRESKYENILLVSYAYNNKFFICSPYNSGWVNPCPNCHVSFVESNSRIAKNGETTFQNIIDLLHTEDVNFKPGTAISKIEYIKILNFINMNIEQFFILEYPNLTLKPYYLEDLNQTFMYDFINKRSYFDSTTYWEMCDCYE